MSWILSLLKFCTFYAVDNAGATSEPTDTNTETTPETEPVNIGEEVWEAIENPEPEADESDVAEVKTEAPKTDEVKADEKPSDITEDDLKPLEGRNAATNERFQKITEGYKSEKSRADLAIQDVERYKNSFDSLKQLGFNDATAANDLVEFSTYRHALATGNVEQFKEIIEAQIKGFQSIHGKSIVITGNIVDDYQDLKTKVDDLDLDEQDAMEIARSRKLQERANRETQNRSTEQRTTEQSQAIINEALSDVGALQGEWKKNDPDYSSIIEHLEPLMADISRTYPPNLWAKTIDLQYKSLKKALVSQARIGSGNDLPLRGNGHMTGKPAPASTEEAVLQAMNMD